MDHLLNKPKLIEFLTQLGKRARSKGACYLTGGASALLIGWRESTLDVDVKFDPEPPGVFDAIAELKRSLQINVEIQPSIRRYPALDEADFMARIDAYLREIE